MGNNLHYYIFYLVDPLGIHIGSTIVHDNLNGVCDVPINSTISLFADDMVLYCVVDSLTQLQYLQDGVDLVSNWISSHYLTLNDSKSKVMFLSRGYVDLVYKTYLNDMPLEIVSEFRYLSITITSEMSWSNQVRLVAVKAKAVIGMIYLILLLC